MKKKVSGKPVRARRTWPRNPKTQVVDNARAYNRQAEKLKKKVLYGEETEA